MAINKIYVTDQFFASEKKQIELLQDYGMLNRHHNQYRLYVLATSISKANEVIQSLTGHNHNVFKKSYTQIWEIDKSHRLIETACEKYIAIVVSINTTSNSFITLEELFNKGV